MKNDGEKKLEKSGRDEWRRQIQSDPKIWILTLKKSVESDEGWNSEHFLFSFFRNY